MTWIDCVPGRRRWQPPHGTPWAPRSVTGNRTGIGIRRVDPGRFWAMNPRPMSSPTDPAAATPPTMPPGPDLLDRLLEADVLPDTLIRFGIRRLLRQRLAEEAVAEDGDRAAAEDAGVGVAFTKQARMDGRSVQARPPGNSRAADRRA